ncbi:SAICAR synthetase [Macleaya cordata]|uniref:SAICAR synthetase n=1 Tax=Macleaya cordata TaxID=56857 RepID=A0A200QXR0_MACCD|nr:SAICAR synthetase [Macleaya cordata]
MGGVGHHPTSGCTESHSYIKWLSAGLSNFKMYSTDHSPQQYTTSYFKSQRREAREEKPPICDKQSERQFLTNNMSQSIPSLNPHKTFSTKTSLLPSFNPATTHLSKLKTKTKMNLPILSSQKPSLDLLANTDHREDVFRAIKGSLSNCLSETNLHKTVPALKSKTRGKVRDVYDGGDYLVMVTTDRQSAFDRVLASIPFKGQVLNETSLWWFDKTLHITPNAVVSSPDKNVTIAKKCSVFPVEFVVRGFVTGSTDTSLWTVYKNGVRNYCGNALPDGEFCSLINLVFLTAISCPSKFMLIYIIGMVKNQKLSANILTPTTKAVDHDVPVTPDEIIERSLMTPDEYDEVRAKALSLFEYGQRVALEHGLLLVDTKYEFGKGSDGTIYLIDEVHTPDSSRYWIANSYEERFQNGLEPENVDKEFLRLWFKDHCNPYEDKVLPDAPEELVCELAWRYIFLYETITKSKFEVPVAEEPIHDRISQNVSLALSSLVSGFVFGAPPFQKMLGEVFDNWELSNELSIYFPSVKSSDSSLQGRVEWALKIKGIEYEYIHEDLPNKSDMLLQYNPVHKKIPVLVHDGKPLAESLVIIEYIDETWKENPILPEDPYEKAMARFWAKFADEKCVASVFSVFSKVGEELDKAVKEARENLKTLEMGLKGKFFGGETIGFVDIAAGWIPLWTRITEEVVGVELVDEESMPLISAWFRDVLDVEVLKERLPPRDKLLAHNKGFRELLLLGYWCSPFALRVEWALKIKGIEYEYINEDLTNKSDMLLQYNPIHKKIPVLVHNGKPLAESLVIIEYIDETWKENPILPEDPYEKATARFWAKFADEKCVASASSVFSKVGEEQEKAVKETQNNLKTLEMGLKGKFFGGERIGFVDVAAGWIPLWIRITEEIVGVELVDEESMPLLSAWFRDVLDVEILKERLPPRDKLLAHCKSSREKLVAATTAAST